MKRVYIAGKITGLSEEEVIQRFSAAKQRLIEQGYIPVSPLDLPHEHDRKWKSYMKEDLAAMKTCDEVYLLSNWRESRGARIEQWLATRNGKSLIYEHQTDLKHNTLQRGQKVVYRGCNALVHALLFNQVEIKLVDSLDDEVIRCTYHELLSVK